MISSTQIRFEIGFPSIPDPVVDAWDSLIGFLDDKGCLPNSFDVSQIAGHTEEFQSPEKLRLSPDAVKALIIQRQLTGFQVYAGNYPRAVSFALLHSKEVGGQSHMRVIGDLRAKVPSDWASLIEGIMTLFPSIGGWQWNALYGAWQGALELHSTYVMLFGQAPPGLLLNIVKSADGIGPDQNFIDISENPGRSKRLLPTIYFHPSAEMWLGPDFWQYAKCTKREAIAADFFMEKRETDHFLYLKCWPEAFTRPDGEQGRMQQRLWRLFFDENCAWPPGSGNISDEPVFGPPELWQK